MTGCSTMVRFVCQHPTIHFHDKNGSVLANHGDRSLSSQTMLVHTLSPTPTLSHLDQHRQAGVRQQNGVGGDGVRGPAHSAGAVEHGL